MHRRTFMNITAGAATTLALKPWALAEEQELKSRVVYPDPAVQVIDPRFQKYKVGNAAVERLVHRHAVGGAELKIMRELLRHSTIRVTLGTYTQAVTAEKRTAQEAVVALLFPEKTLET